MGSACTRKRNNPEANLPNIETCNTIDTEKIAFPKSNYNESIITSEDYGGSAEKVYNKNNFSTF